MRILVLSDSHGDWHGNISKALSAEKDAVAVYFLGDGQKDILTAVQNSGLSVPLIAVRGNCDGSSRFPLCDIRSFGTVGIFATHGHCEHVKYGLYELAEAAANAKCKVALFGHTHEPYYFYENGIYFLNPGSIRDGCYGAVDILDSGILCSNLRVND